MPGGIIRFAVYVESTCTSVWVVALEHNSTDYSVNGAPCVCTNALIELGEITEGLENHNIFPSKMGYIVVERTWNLASDAWGSSSKSVWSRSPKASYFFSTKRKCWTRSFLIFSTCKTFDFWDLVESRTPWKVCELGDMMKMAFKEYWYGGRMAMRKA